MIFSVVSNIEGWIHVAARIMSKAPRHGRFTFNSVEVALHLTRSNSRPAHAANSSPYWGYALCKLQTKPERERNAEMAGTGPPAQHGFGIAWAQGSTKFDGQYRGELTLTKIINGDCIQPPLGAVYPLTKSRGEVRFVYVPDSTPHCAEKLMKTGF